MGIFVHSVEAGSAAAAAGLRCGDRILEYNGADLRRATAEQAACELAKPADKVTVRVVHRYQRYVLTSLHIYIGDPVGSVTNRLKFFGMTSNSVCQDDDFITFFMRLFAGSAPSTVEINCPAPTMG